MAGSLEIFARLGKAYGDLDWWPVDRAWHAAKGTDWRFEVIVGAFLTQNTTWTSVEKALENLRAKELLSPKAMARTTPALLREAIRPAGYYNQKASYLQAFAKYLWTTFKGDLDAFFRRPTPTLRELLLSFTGVGDETADDILVYAAQRPSFIVDAYTRRLTHRLGIGTGEEPYRELQDLWGRRLGDDVAQHAKGHALIVEHCKRRCTAKAPTCPGCPLERICKRVDVEATVYLRAAQSGARAEPPR